MTHASAVPEPDRLYSREEFRRWCERQERARYERFDGKIVASATERGAHIRVKGAVYLALYRAIKASGCVCEALIDGATVESGDSDYEPDATVYCGPLLDDDAIAVPNPMIVVEVLAPAAVDSGLKLAGYFRKPSIAHYLIVNPLKRCVIHHRRTPDGIETRILVGGIVAMDPPGIAISVQDIYAVG